MNGASYPVITDEAVKAFRIPRLPVEVQAEIAKVLDTFTTLEAELEAELETRRRQYQYYRDALLTFGGGYGCCNKGQVGDFGGDCNLR